MWNCDILDLYTNNFILEVPIMPFKNNGEYLTTEKYMGEDTMKAMAKGIVTTKVLVLVQER